MKRNVLKYILAAILVLTAAVTAFACSSSDGEECTDCGTVIVEQITGYGNHEYQNGACIHCGETENVSQGLKMALDPSGNGYIVVNEGTCTDKDIVIPRLYNGLPLVVVRPLKKWFCPKA